MFVLYCSGLGTRAAGSYQNNVGESRGRKFGNVALWVTVDCCSKFSLLSGF